MTDKKDNDVCGSRWTMNSAVQCRLETHDKDVRHHSHVTKHEVIDYGTARVTSETTDTVEWDDPLADIQRQLSRVVKHREE